jgi:hypothetical protein
MRRKVFIVLAGYTAIYKSLKRALAGEDDVEVLYDRRQSRRPDDPRRRSSSIWSGGPLGDLAERRMPSHVDDDLRTRGWAVVTFDD